MANPDKIARFIALLLVAGCAMPFFCAGISFAAPESATVTTISWENKAEANVKALVIVFSYHHKNTEKIAQSFAKVLDAPIKTPQQVDSAELQNYNFIGFGSGIYAAKHHESLLALADNLPPGNGKKVFIFSTFGAPAGLFDEKELKKFIAKNHAKLRDKLQSKGYTVIDEFACPGFNTNSFLKLFGGLNKGRPNAQDLKQAEDFARNLKTKMGAGAQ